MRASRAEIKIQEILEMNNIPFAMEYTFPFRNLPQRKEGPNNHFIYIHINTLNGKMYVGQTVSLYERWKCKGERYKGCPLFYNAIQKYGWENFRHFVIEKDLTQSKANEREYYWIKKLKTTQIEFGYNLMPGGSQYMTELWASPEYREKMHKSFSQSRQKHWQDPLFREKSLSCLLSGLSQVWNDPEWREKRIQNIMGDKNPNSKAVKNIETGKIFTTITEAAKWAGLKSISGIGQCCKGIQKHSGRHPEAGELLTWEYAFKKEGDA